MKLTEKEKQLAKKLLAIWDDSEFAAGVLAYLETEDERQAIIDYIDTNEDVTIDNLVLLSLHIARLREQNK